MENYAWMGHLLKVDLTHGNLHTEASDPYVGEYLGGRGMGQKVLFDMMSPNTGALDPESVLIFATGPLTGTLAPGSGRLSISGKNVLTGGVGSSNVGGHFGPELKYAGFDSIIVEGKSTHPVYLFIENNKVSLHNAQHLKDKTTWETEAILKTDHGQTTRVLSIGPAGERMAPISCIIVDNARAAGRCGFGAIMGSKNLKAIAVRGSLPIHIADPERFITAVDKSRKKLLSTDTLERMRTHGTCGSVARANASCTIPVKNFQDDHMDEEKLSQVLRSVFQENFQVRNLSCMGCFYRDTFLYEINEGEFAPLFVEGFHQNLIWDFAGKLLITEPSALLKIQALCSQYGLDIDNTSGALSFAFELYEKGIINKKETDGLELRWGDYRTVVKLIEKMAYGVGFGGILNQGAFGSSKSIGRGSEKYAIHIKGQDLAESIRADKGWALGTVVAPRGGGHLNGASMTGMMKISPEDSETIFGTPYGGEQDTYRGKPSVVYYYEMLKSVVDAIGVCYFTSQWVDIRFQGAKDYGEFLSAAAGIEISEEELMLLGRKIHNIEKGFNTLHADFSRIDDFPPKRFFDEPIKSGPYKGSVFDRDEWLTMLKEYYSLHGWDPETGLQTESTLMKLNLPFLVDKLKDAGKLPH